MLFNLALSLLAVNITFMAGINATYNDVICKTVAALIQYFLLVSFAWMMVEAVVQYFKFVKVLDTYVDKFMLKACIPAYGEFTTVKLKNFKLDMILIFKTTLPLQ